MLELSIRTPEQILFEGRAASIILPGEMGVFEVLPFHKPLMSRLISGIIIFGQTKISITRGIVRVAGNKVTAIIQT